ncbi:MAG: C10 family peptidase, partial [Melioribacteraceae bacterium]|nr:C10 family peptidase [Melioribacteraceae bacterium]
MKSIFLFLSLLFIGIISFSQETGGPYIPDENTVLLMHFDGNATNSANVGSDGIEHGSGISYEDGVHGQCLRLDNSTPDKQSWIEVPFYDELNFTEEFSIECWFKINSWGNDHTYIPTLFKKGENWPADYDSGLGSSENTFWANLNCVNDEYSRNIKVDTYPGVISDGSWYHISLTFKPQTEPEYWMYMDLLIRDENYKEVFATTGFAPTPPFNSNEKLLIGFGKSDNSYFDGWIDEFRISKKARKYRDDIISTINTEDFKDSVPPMLRDRWTTYYPPITKYFPIDTITGERYKGNSCGMTIMIRLLHFWEHPRFPSGNIDYWFGSVHWQADFDNTEYLFDLMPDKFGPNPTEEEYAASAIFAQQVSAATRIYYDNMNSMPQLLTDYFHYKEGMKLYFRHQFTKEEWIKIFKNELSQGRPIMAAGLEEIFDEGGAAGHYYIVDGYSLEGKFHSDESFGEVDFWVDIDSFPYGNFQTIMIGAEPDWHGKTLTLDYPKGNEYFQKQTEIEISWESGNISTVLLEYSTDAGKNWQTLAENVDAATGSYLWTIPDISSEEYKVRISDTEDGNVYRRCETFNVFDRQIVEFEYPGAGNVIQSGIEQPLYWQSEGIQAFKLEYSTDMTS